MGKRSRVSLKRFGVTEGVHLAKPSAIGIEHEHGTTVFVAE